MKGLFITGTDTGCGKTCISLGLLQRYQQQGLRVQGMKPVASGCTLRAGRWENADARQLLEQSSQPMPYDWVNPYAFAPAIAPHLAAQQAGIPIELERIWSCAAQLARQSDGLIVEGVGGWQVPLGPALAVSDLPRALELPVVLVVGMRLGCLNHALLSLESIDRCRVPLAGWVANTLDPKMAAFQENLRTLQERIPAPLLGLVPWCVQPDGKTVAQYLDPSALPGFR